MPHLYTSRRDIYLSNLRRCTFLTRPGVTVTTAGIEWINFFWHLLVPDPGGMSGSSQFRCCGFYRAWPGFVCSHSFGISLASPSSKNQRCSPLLRLPSEIHLLYHTSWKAWRPIPGNRFSRHIIASGDHDCVPRVGNTVGREIFLTHQAAYLVLMGRKSTLR